jgi:hypothetical protein
VKAEPLLLAGLAAVGAATTYSLVLRTRCLNWGAEPSEVYGPMPGDALLPGIKLVTTRAVTVDAPPEAIWPWLVQMGPGRGGAYTYDWIENLFGLDMHSADRVLLEFQDLQVGDAMRLGTKGPCMRVEILEPSRAMVLRSDDGRWVWAFGLAPSPFDPPRPGDRRTRLVSRNRIAPAEPGVLERAFYRYVMEPGSLVMERKMLLGIKKRAEALYADETSSIRPVATASSR